VTFRRSGSFLIMLFALLLSACSLSGLLGGNRIVGRWEFFYNDEHTVGTVYELYSDGTGAVFSFASVRAFEYPPTIAPITYKYDRASGLLELKPADDPSGLIKVRTYQVTFVSDDEISMDDKVTSKVEQWPYLRAPIPDLPIGARSRLGNLLLSAKRSLVSVERLAKDWQSQYPGYVEANTLDDETVAKDPEKWLAVIQEAGETQPRLYILVEGRSYRWEVVRLEKQE
jgi:hypothetical protein